MDISMENEIDELNSNSGLACFIHFHINALGRGMNPALLPSLRYGLNDSM